MHSAAFCVNPRFHGINHFEDMEVRDDFVSVVSDMLGDAHEAKVLEVITGVRGLPPENWGLELATLLARLQDG
jgi:hypothetical protein